MVLSWTSDHPSRWKTFVANRFAEIQSIIPLGCWHHVKGSGNPADCAFKGLLNPADLQNNELWWTEPQFLRNPNLLSSQNSPIEVSPEVAKEERKKKNNFHVIIDDSIIADFSQLTRLIRVTAFCLRFSYNCKYPNNKKTGALTPEELNKALRVHLKTVQHISFHQDICQLREGKPLANKSSLLSLQPFLDYEEILRVKGHLRHAELAMDHMHPCLLPQRHKLTTLIIDNEHNNCLYAGAQLVTASPRERFWTVNARNVVRQGIRQCVKCTTFQKGTINEPMGDLPA